ncbi:hypothetical protein GCM10029978_066390 [Actinoallomurus acanthiterrae]
MTIRAVWAAARVMPESTVPQMPSLGWLVRQTRLVKGMTQEDLAGNDFNRKFISSLELGLSEFDDRSFKIIADRLGISYDEREYFRSILHTFPRTQLAARSADSIVTPGDRMRSLRVGRGMRQLDLAAASGLSKGYLAQVETGRRGIGKDTARLLANALGCHPSHLSDGPDRKELARITITKERADRSFSHGEFQAALANYQIVTADSNVELIPRIYADVTYAIAQCLEAFGEFKAAISGLLNLRRRISTRDEHWSGTEALLARCYRRLGNLSKAELVVQAAQKVAARHNTPPIDATLLRIESISVRAERGESSAAMRMARQVVNDLDQMRSPQRRVTGLSRLAEIALRCGDVTGAVAFASEAYVIGNAYVTASPAHLTLEFTGTLRRTGNKDALESALIILGSESLFGHAIPPESTIRRLTLLTEINTALGRPAEGLRYQESLILELDGASIILRVRAFTALGQAHLANGESIAAGHFLKAASALVNRKGLRAPNHSTREKIEPQTAPRRAPSPTTYLTPVNENHNRAGNTLRRR